MESKRNLIDIFHKKLKHELYKNDDAIKFTELLKNDKWQNIIKKYNIRDLYSLCFNNVFLFGIVKDDNFKNNLINLIKNDWSNIGKYNPLSIDEQREFGWKNYQLILKSIYCFDTESQHFYDLFDFFIEKKDSILTNNLYSLCSEISEDMGYVNMHHIFKKIKETKNNFDLSNVMFHAYSVDYVSLIDDFKNYYRKNNKNRAYDSALTEYFNVNKVNRTMMFLQVSNFNYRTGFKDYDRLFLETNNFDLTDYNINLKSFLFLGNGLFNEKIKIKELYLNDDDFNFISNNISEIKENLKCIINLISMSDIDNKKEIVKNIKYRYQEIIEEISKDMLECGDLMKFDLLIESGFLNNDSDSNVKIKRNKF